MTSDPNFADYDGGRAILMPDWFDDDLIQAVLDVGVEIPDLRHVHDPRPASKAKALARHLRLAGSS